MLLLHKIPAVTHITVINLSALSLFALQLVAHSFPSHPWPPPAAPVLPQDPWAPISSLPSWLTKHLLNPLAYRAVCVVSL